MVALETPSLNKNWQAPNFSLPGTDGKHHTLADVSGKNGLLVIFMCNHCPFVKAILHKIIRDAKELQAQGIGVVAISANDANNYPEDSFENMQHLSNENELPFPYLLDETQEVAKAYDAVCTPDFFGFNQKSQLQYRGRLDDAGLNDKPDSTRELYNAMSLIATTNTGPEEQKPSIGCSIKWKK